MSRTASARVYIFDWDGTLIDSVGRIVDCLRQAARDLDLRLLADTQYSDVIGLGLPEVIRRLYPALDATAADAYRDCYSARFVAAEAQPCSLFPDAIETLTQLRHRGHRVAVATGKSRRGLDRALRTNGLQDFFDVTRCADETASKPDPRMLHEILAELGACASEALMIGDTEYDMEMASRAGVHRVGVSFGVHAPARLARHGTLRVLDSLAELRDWWPGSGREHVVPEIREKTAQADQGETLETCRVVQAERAE